MKTILATAAVLFAANGAMAADAPAAAALATAAATSAIVPAVTVGKPGSRSRAEVRAEAVEAAKHHKTALALQLEQYK